MDKKIKMAIVRPYAAPIDLNSYNSQEIGLARGLVKQGLDVDIFLAGKEKNLVCHDIVAHGEGRIKLYELPYLKIPEIQQAIYPKLKSLLINGQYDFVQVNEENELTSFLVAKYCRRNNIPVVVYQGMYLQLNGRIMSTWQNIYDKLFLPKLRGNINLALAKTTWAENHLKKKGFNRTMVMPVGLDKSVFEPKENSKDLEDWYSSLDIPRDKPVVLYIGVFEKRRNVDFMVDLAKHCKIHNITFLMIGNGPDFERIQERVKDEQVSNIFLPGKIQQKDLAGVYEMSAISLLPSEYEIYGMVVLESMYFGVPVFSTRTAGPADIIAHNQDGMIFDGVDVDEWRTALINIFSEDSFLNEMAIAGREKIVKSLTWDAVAGRYLSEVIEPEINKS